MTFTLTSAAVGLLRIESRAATQQAQTPVQKTKMIAITITIMMQSGMRTAKTIPTIAPAVRVSTKTEMVIKNCMRNA